MKQVNAFLLSFFYLLLTSCGQTYTTPIRNDPFFVIKPLDQHVLRESGEPYVQREDQLADKGDLKPRKGESYVNFKQRVFNTLLLHERNKEVLASNLIDQEQVILKNEQLFTEVQKENLDLRLSIARAKSGGAEATDVFSRLFKLYTVKKGDTLQKIAYHTYASYDAWLMIYQYNLDELKKGPNKIYPGQKLLLPNLEAFNRK